MEVLRRNTDYALRMMTLLARRYEDGEALSARRLAEECGVSYALARKLLQILHKNELVRGQMGLRGGFVLGKRPKDIVLREVVDAMQGRIHFNRCLVEGAECTFKENCGISDALVALQEHVSTYLGQITLEEVAGKRTGAGAIRDG